MLCAGYTIAKSRMYFVQRATGLLAPREVFSPVTVPARTFNQISDFKIKAVIWATGGGRPLWFSVISLTVLTGTVC